MTEQYNFRSDILDYFFKSSIIKPIFKVELLDWYENTIGEITENITTNNGGNVSINYQQGVRRSCTFTLVDTFGDFVPTANPTIFGFNSKFKLYTGLEVEGSKFWYSQGVFFTTNPVAAHANSDKTITVTGVDKFGLFTSDTGYNQLEGTYVIPAQSDINKVIKDILALPLGNGYMVDPITPFIDPIFKDYKTPYEIKKAPGSYMGDILIELANVLGADIYYDIEGVLTIMSGTTDISYSQQSSIWDFSDKELEYSNSSISFNTVDLINSVRVVGNEVDEGTVYIGTAENHNFLSPTAIEKIGVKMYYEDNANLPNQERADEYARYILKIKSIIQSSVTFNSTFLPFLDVNRVITITDNFFNYVQERFIIQSLTIPFDARTLMSITCSNIASLPYYELRTGG